MSITSVVNDVASSVSVINAQKPLPPTISGYSVGGLDDTALDPAGGQTVQINGTGFLAGATITFDGSAVAVVTYVNSNRLTFTSPAKTAGTYTIYVVNPDGGTAIFIPGIIYSVLPTWTTSAGSLGSYYETTSISNTVVASGDAPITYSLFSGSLPTGSTLYANGVITGTAPVDSSSTTYSFTIQATDAQLQDSTRSFSLTINVDAVTWVSPANNTTYTSAVDSAIANVTLSATDAAGYAVSYSANALPTGLSLSGANISGTPTVIADSSTLLTATAATTNRSATRTINWSITVANDPYFEYNTLLIPGASTTFVDDASTNNFAVSIFGDTRPNNFNPYTPGYYSNYFDGSGDYATVQSNAGFGFSGDFTVEFWFSVQGAGDHAQQHVFQTRDGTNNGLLFQYDRTNKNFSVQSDTGLTGLITANNAINDGTWYHIACSRSGTTIYFFVNGALIASTTSSQNFNATTPYISRRYATDGFFHYFNGFVSNLRLIKNSAVYTSAFTPPTTPLIVITGTQLLTCQSNRFIDVSVNNSTITTYGNTSVNSFDPFTPNSSYSTYGSGYFDGTGDYLSVDDNSAFALSNSNFTMEAWIYPTATGDYPTIAAQYGSGINSSFFWSLGPTANPRDVYFIAYLNGNTVTAQASNVVVLNTWSHHAVVRNSGTLTYYINGVSVATASIGSSSLIDSTRLFTIGNSGESVYTSYPFTGYITNVRVVKGTAVYTSAFTPPTEPLTAIANTSLLTLQNNQSVNNNVFLDNSTNNFFVTRNGNTTQGTFSPYGGNWSNYVDTAYQGISNATSLIGATVTTFTAECWIYMTAAPASGDGVPCLIGMDAQPASSIYLGFGPNASRQLVLRWFDGASKTATGGTALALNTWYHIAVVSNSNSIAMYVNGVAETLSGTTTLTNRNGTASSFALMSNSSATAYQFKGYVSNIRVTTTAVYTSAFTPSTTPLTPITGTKLLTSQSNRIVDSSINNYTLTLAGSVTIQRFSPFNPSSVTPTSYSGYFDGTGDYLTVPANTSLALGAGDFTIECWINITGAQTTTYGWGVFGTYDGISNLGWSLTVNRSSGGYGILFIASGAIQQGYTSAYIPTTTWTHLAVVRSGSSTNNLKTYLNGVQVSTSTYTTNDTLAAICYIGSQGTGQQFPGYISNIRLVKGTAVYTGNFTPPTTPLTAITNTALLTCQSPTFIDNSTNNFTISAFGNSRSTQQNPFGFTSTTTEGYTVSTIGGSAYFDGTGDYLTVSTLTPATSLANGNWTIECWFYASATKTFAQIMGNRSSASGNTAYVPIVVSYESAIIKLYSSSNGSSWNLVNAGTIGTVSLQTWNHVAIVRNGNNLEGYLNGTKVTLSTGLSSISFTATNLFYASGLGDPFAGYVSDMRLVTGTVLYTSNFVPPAQPLLAVQNTVLLNNMTSAGIYDAAMMNNMETVGDAKLSTAISKFGGSSMSFDGTGDYLYGAWNPNLELGSGNFTIEFWIYAVGGNSLYCWSTDWHYAMTWNYGGASSNRVGIWASSNGSTWNIFNADSGGNGISTGTISTNTWTHVALVRNGSAWALYLNGTSAWTGTSSATIVTRTDTFRIGGPWPNAGPADFNGYIDDLRITKGYARYTANFTAPTTAFPVY